METAEQIAALEGFAIDNVDLERLKGLLVETDVATLKALRNFESLAANNPDFEKLKELHRKWSAEFDAIAFLELSRKEWFHSRFLAWLLDPEGNHGTGTYFLENFLRKTGFSEIDEAVWTQTSVQQEWRHRVDDKLGYLDILLVNRKEMFLCAIENKVFSGEHSGQLGRYRKALDKSFPDLTRHYVFLSPGGMPPEQEEEQKHWVPVTYATILELVEDTLENGKTAGMRKDVRVFLKQYETTLRRNIVHKHPEKVQELARKIYLENREVIELIYDNKPKYSDEMQGFFREAVGKRRDWKIAMSGGDYIRFLPVAWEDFTGLKTGRWLNQEELLLFEFECSDNDAKLQLALMPGTDESIRRKIIEEVNANPNVFNPAFQECKPGNWLKPHIGENIIEEKHLNDWDKDDGSYIRNKIMGWVKCFAQNDFPKMNEVIVNCFKEYEARQVDSSGASSRGDVSA